MSGSTGSMRKASEGIMHVQTGDRVQDWICSGDV